MRKAVVIGGSNGIGLAVSAELIERGFFVEICSRTAPEQGVLDAERYHHNRCDLADFHEDLFRTLSEDPDVQLLFLSAGIGRIADFQYHHLAEIDKMLTVDTVSSIKIFRVFYDRIMNDPVFYAGIMGSISGWISSPSASVYAAAKAAVVRFVESVNVELEAYGSQNRILDVSPGSFKGSKFYGGKNDLSLTIPLAREILQHLFERDTRFIPAYEEVYRGVLQRYHDDPHGYGLHSYNYKKDSGRLDNQTRVRIGYLSGTFDQYTIDIVNSLMLAKRQCDFLIVCVCSSDSKEDRSTFATLEERAAIVGACRYVDKAVVSAMNDIEAWYYWRYNRLFVQTDDVFTQQVSQFMVDKGVKLIRLPKCEGEC